MLRTFQQGRSLLRLPDFEPHEDGDDFIIGETEKDFIDCAGIESPGLSSAPAIGEMVADILKKKYDLREKEDFISIRKGIADLNSMTIEERNEYIRRNPAYGNIICRCEMVSEGEIIDAIKRPIGARSLDGVKRRTRAGMGRCQAADIGIIPSSSPAATPSCASSSVPV